MFNLLVVMISVRPLSQTPVREGGRPVAKVSQGEGTKSRKPLEFNQNYTITSGGRTGLTRVGRKGQGSSCIKLARPTVPFQQEELGLEPES